MLGCRALPTRICTKSAAGHRPLTGTCVRPSAKAFSETLLLPKTKFPLKNHPSKDEVLCKRTSEDLYQWQWKNARGPLFVLHDGPPYANGDLHMGHALNKILKDIINRYHVSIGERVHYFPGWDCHGLPIENKVLKALGKDLSEADSVTIRKEAEKYAKEQIQSQMAQFKQFGIMSGWTTDTTYRTLDHDYEIRQLRIFQKMVERGLIYRHHRPVYYSPSSRSALAEAELEYKDSHVSHSVYVSYDLDLIQRDGWSPALRELIRQQPRVQLLVWTTTPWTFTANMAIAVNPEMRYIVMIDQKKPELGAVIFATERRPALRSILQEMQWDTVLGEIQGSDLAHASYRPLFSKLVDAPSLPVIPSSHVTPSSGTGLVHCAPAHGQEDYAVFRALGLIPASSASSIVCHVDSLGKFKPTVAEVLGNGFRELVEGKDVLGEGGKAMVSVLREIGVLRKIERIKHRYPYDWKTDQPVITMATSQWFASLDAIKDDAIVALQDVRFEPAQSRNRLETYVRSRSEWCISRQRVWGVPIPALYHLPTNRAILDYASLSHILSILGKKGVRHWWHGSVEEFVPPDLRIDGENVNETWIKGTDTMDVWFDSGTSWSMLEGLTKDDKVADRREGQYADVCLEGSDQHRGWFQSQLLTAVGCAQPGRTRVSPYGTLITHGMVLDEKGKKMSKSLGNIVSPMTIINGGENLKQDPGYGTEVLRLWAATVESGNDMSIGPKILSQCMESVRKIRNSTRFILGNLGDKRQPQQEKVTHEHFSLADRYVMHKLYELESTSLGGYAKYDFARVVSSLSNFANITLSSLYFHITKDCLYADAPNSIGRRAVVTVMDQILETMTSVMAPILPHVAEEIHQTLHSDNAHVSSVFCEPWKPLSSEWNDPLADSEMTVLLGIRDVVLSLLEKARRNKELGSSLEADVDLLIPDGLEESLIELLGREETFLKQLFVVSDVSIMDEGSLGVFSPLWLYTDSVTIPGCVEDLVVRVRPATAHKCPRCWTFARHEGNILCGRCSEVVEGATVGSTLPTLS